MTKINEYMELLVSEMEEFRGDINRLEAINKNVKELKIGFDLAPAKSILNEHVVEIEKLQNFQQNQYGRLESLFKRAGVYPKWAIIIFIVSMLFTLTSILYAYHTKSNSSKVEQIGFEKGVAEYDNHIEAFFSENEKARKQYEIWKNKELSK